MARLVIHVDIDIASPKYDPEEVAEGLIYAEEPGGFYQGYAADIVAAEWSV